MAVHDLILSLFAWAVAIAAWVGGCCLAGHHHLAWIFEGSVAACAVVVAAWVRGSVAGHLFARMGSGLFVLVWSRVLIGFVFAWGVVVVAWIGGCLPGHLFAWMVACGLFSLVWSLGVT